MTRKPALDPGIPARAKAMGLSILAATALSAMANGLENEAVFVPREQVAAGSANLSSPQQGMYVYGSRPADGRPAQAAFLVGKPRRHDYRFFGDLEEEALWNLKQAWLERQPQDPAGPSPAWRTAPKPIRSAHRRPARRGAAQPLQGHRSAWPRERSLEARP